MAKKRVLIVYYSQTGQLTATAKSVAGPLEKGDDTEVVYENLFPEKAYPFPWPFFTFLDVFPESVYMDGPKLNPLGVQPDDKFDLVILAYQTWFLSPCLPMTGFLQTDTAAKILKDTPVLTLIACRNMWIKGQEKLKARLAELGAKYIDNAVLVDGGPSFATFFTTPFWLLLDKKEGFLGFPPAGVSEVDIAGASRFGDAIVKGLAVDKEKSGEPLLAGLGAVNVNTKYILGENTAHRSFLIWGRLLRKAGPQGAPIRKVLLTCYVTFLITFILTFIPLTIVLKILLAPLLKKRLMAEKARLELPSGSDRSLMVE
ncbi:hypothetical protein BVY04_03635 [bacterium M21]|nr:hypothetical protein BVY04_03635 [bacterium M21]